jgi:hypothetical protein
MFNEGVARRFLTGLLACVCWLASDPDWRVTAQQTASQQPGQTPAFKSRVDLVRADVAVIDNKTGRSVTGLTARDFAIDENGVRARETAAR